MVPHPVSDYSFLFDLSHGHIRVPIWGHIPLENAVRAVIGHPHFFRLRGIRQLSFVEYVFPGATHTRLEHSIGVYYLTTRIFQYLVQNPVNLQSEKQRAILDAETIRTLQAGALLHDLGHYPHAHLLENLSLSHRDPEGFTHHQDLAADFLYDRSQGPSLADILQNDWNVDPERVFAIITGDKKKEPTAKIVSGILDPDKMDYLIRDAHHCAVPYASVDIWRLVESFILDADRNRLSITPKGIASFESLMFSKYMMTRHIYWHHTVKTMGCMLKRLLQDLMDGNVIAPDELKNLIYESNDDQVLFAIKNKVEGKTDAFLSILDLIIHRKPYKKLAVFNFTREKNSVNAIYVPPGVMDHHSIRYDKAVQTDNKTILSLNRLQQDAVVRKTAEERIARSVSDRTGTHVESHEILLDIPGFHTIFEYDDLRDLRLYSEKTGTFHPFSGHAVTSFQPAWISEMETASRMVQILIHPRHSELANIDWTHLLEEVTQ